jgi:hypothetical protein
VIVQDILGKISVTFDGWTSKSRDAYLSFTIHYITSPPDCLMEWQLENEVLALPHLEGGHSSLNQGDVIVRVVDHYEISKKVSHSHLSHGLNDSL